MAGYYLTVRSHKTSYYLIRGGFYGRFDCKIT